MVFKYIKCHPEAVADVDRLYKFLVSKNPDAAVNAVSTILKGARQLKSHPRLGRPVSDMTERRKLFVSFSAGAYVLTCRLEDETTATIIRVWHCKENRL